MRARTFLIVPSALAVASLAWAEIPQSWSFENQNGRLVPGLAESTSNEKEVEFGDLDLDGDPDMVVAVGSSDFGERRNKLYLNSGGTYLEVGGTTLIPEFGMEDVSRNAFIRDYTGDGFPDIYIINDSNSGGFAGTDKLYRALHSGGNLTGYAQEGATRIPMGGDLGAACGGVTFDFDGDGDFDVYSGNYPGPSQDRGLFNDGSGFLSDLTSSLIPTDGDYTVDVALGDMNGDGKMDLLVSNDNDPSYIYYNHNRNAGSQLGDFKYTNSTTNLGTAVAAENAMEAADFDNDGDMDFIWTNEASSNGDRIHRNDGNDLNGKATFTTLNNLPANAVNTTSRKATVADFNGDKRIDIFIATQNGSRPTVVRNTSVEGGMSFVDWTPAPAFPSNNTLRGWHGAAFDTGPDGDIDIVVGGFIGDHLLENVPANEVNETDLGAGTLPSFFNGEPVAVSGTAADGESDEYTLVGVGSGFLSVVLNGNDDYRLELLTGGGAVMATSDRGGLGVEEAFQATVSPGTYSLRVTVLAAGGCATGDLDCDGDIGFSDLLEVLTSWGCLGCPADINGDGAGFDDLLFVLTNWGPTGGGAGAYLLEVLGRTG